MTYMSKFALSIAITLGIVSAASAATVRHPRAAVARQLPGANAYGYAMSGTADPAVLAAQRREQAGDPRCWGGNCDPTWTSAH